MYVAFCLRVVMEFKPLLPSERDNRAKLTREQRVHKNRTSMCAHTYIYIYIHIYTSDPSPMIPNIYMLYIHIYTYINMYIYRDTI